MRKPLARAWRDRHIVHVDAEWLVVDRPPLWRDLDARFDQLADRLVPAPAGIEVAAPNGSSGLALAVPAGQAKQFAGIPAEHLLAVPTEVLRTHPSLRDTVVQKGRAGYVLRLDAPLTATAIDLLGPGSQIAGPQVVGSKGLIAGSFAPLWHIESLKVGDKTFRSPCPWRFDEWVRNGHCDVLESSAPLEEMAQLLTRAMEDAADRRFGLTADDTTCVRLVHGAGDGMEGVEVDQYGSVLVVGLRSRRALELEDMILDAADNLGASAVFVKRRPQKASDLVDTRRDAVAPTLPVRGECTDETLVVTEHGVPYVVRPGDGLSTGIFLDQRDNRKLVVKLSESARVLNLFCYHAAFSVAAAFGGAATTTNIDTSKRALDRARENLEAVASVTGRDTESRFVPEDALTWLGRAARKREQFDLVIVDPPTFSSHKKKVFRVAKDYRRLCELAFRCLAPGGTLLATTNHRGTTPEQHLKQLRAASVAAGIALSQVTSNSPPADHPPPPGGFGHLKTVVAQRSP